MRTVVVVGEPGVRDAWGAASLLGAELGLATWNAGDLIRAAAHDRTAWGARFEDRLRAGRPVPDELIVEFVVKVVSAAGDGWLLFGFPKLLRQAELLAACGHAPGVAVEVLLDETRIGGDRRLAGQGDRLRESITAHRTRMAPVRDFYRATGGYRAVPETASLTRLTSALREAVLTGP